MKQFTVTYTIYGGILVDAENAEEAKRNFLQLTTGDYQQNADDPPEILDIEEESEVDLA